MPDHPVEPIFLLSLPRSGSTLLQRLLASHSQVSTAPEPWLLLPLLYARRPHGAYAEYGHRVAAMALEDLVQRLPGGVDDYLAAVRRLALETYGALAGGCPYFLDKTPRYSLVVDDLLRAFPDARFICLWRNPLAIVASLTASWAGGRWRPWMHKVDLYDGLAALCQAVTLHPDRFTVVRYEAVVKDPVGQCEALFAALGLPSEPSVVADFARLELGGTVGDKTGTATYDHVSTASLSKWREALASPVRKAWCRQYVEWIGDRRLATMGYDIDGLRAAVDELEDDWRRLVPDAYLSAKGVIYNLLEPPTLRAKLRSARSWRDVHNLT